METNIEIEVVEEVKTEDQEGEKLLQEAKELEEEISNIQSPDIDTIVDEDETLEESDKVFIKDLLKDDEGNLDINIDKIQTGTLKRSLEKIFVEKKELARKIISTFYTSDGESVKHKHDLFTMENEGVTYHLRDEFKVFVDEGANKYFRYTNAEGHEVIKGTEGSEGAPYEEIRQLYIADFTKIDTEWNKLGDFEGKAGIYQEYLFYLNKANEMIYDNFYSWYQSRANATHVEAVFGVNEKNIESIKKSFKSIENKKEFKSRKQFAAIGFRRIFESYMKGKSRKKVTTGMVQGFFELTEDLTRVAIIAYELATDSNKDFKEVLDKINNREYESSEIKDKIKIALYDIIRVAYKDTKVKSCIATLERDVYSEDLLYTPLFTTLRELFKATM